AVVVVDAVEDQQRVVAVVVELGLLAELLDVFDGERVPAQQRGELVDLRLAGLQEIEPEELVGGEQPFDAAAVDAPEGLHPGAESTRLRLAPSPRPARRSARAPAAPPLAWG